jgi:hypothetical protein
MAGRPTFKYYEAGSDLDLSPDPQESFRLFQGLIRDEYETLVPEFGLVRIDATLSLIRQQQHARRLVQSHLEGVMRLGGGGIHDALRQTGLAGRYVAGGSADRPRS